MADTASKLQNQRPLHQTTRHTPSLLRCPSLFQSSLRDTHLLRCSAKIDTRMIAMQITNICKSRYIDTIMAVQHNRLLNARWCSSHCAQHCLKKEGQDEVQLYKFWA